MVDFGLIHALRGDLVDLRTIAHQLAFQRASAIGQPDLELALVGGIAFTNLSDSTKKAVTIQGSTSLRQVERPAAI
ncbi:hypothetical protein [Sphingobium algorifonticola]|uniref:Uncharacterized protein n=1 Tax=Sphingobium algorifonticola TaxID=2008318 RepID=A0A437J425_9SPHN|nr:hypothetical protein [Sphingobium algorifonticola]RVT39414.1 hypothetical protein ENE74_15305 [Sphingobium algorifonticola]